ncbi:Isoflavone 2'-hydroxylase [Zea mays]|uniref:Isoflavone 2'-hydroxylase n=1 Tax=Zea mays TaxID=4577 RepID=A0A317YG35_MAIZE|nr:Isoflavone 2'-hydroxylase [Zea mays]
MAQICSVEQRVLLYLDHDMVFIPINIQGTHWYLIVINARNMEIQVLDSLGTSQDRKDLTDSRVVDFGKLPKYHQDPTAEELAKTLDCWPSMNYYITGCRYVSSYAMEIHECHTLFVIDHVKKHVTFIDFTPTQDWYKHIPYRSHAGWCQRHIQTPKQRSIDQSKLVGQNISCSTTTTMDKAYVAVLSFAFLFVIHYLVGRAGRKGNGKGKGTQRLPPSPPAVPFLGHLHLVKTPFHEALAGLAARHGPVFSMRMGSRRALVVSSPDCAKECFTEHDVAFANRPRFATQDLVSFGGAALAAASYGPYWRNLRRVATVQLLSAHRVACMSAVVAAEVRAMARRMGRAAAAAPGGAARVQLKRRLFEVSLSVLMETIARTKTSRAEADADSDMSPEAHEFKQIVDEIVPHLGTANLWDYLPVLRWLDVFGVRNKITAAKSEPEVYTDTMIMALCGDPDEFRPERFEDGKAEGRLLMPFGMGRRKCPGETLALRTISLVLGTLIQCFDWDRVDGHEIDMAAGGGLTLPKAVPLEATCKPRAAMRHLLLEL